MRDFHLPGRSPVLATGGVAATSHPVATVTALDVLREGGNAVDAAVAACAVLCVIEPHMTAIGGDCFALLAKGGGDEVIALNGSGRAPAAATPDRMAELGLSEIPQFGPHPVTVPGCVDAWSRLVEAHGRKSLGELLAPAIRCAEDGVPVAPRVAHNWARDVAALDHDENARRIYMPEGRAPAIGEIFRQPLLGETLRRIAEEGRAGFYEGPVAEDMVSHLNALGGLHTLEDFARTEASFVEPIRTNYRGHDIYECPPNGQGIVALIMLNILSGYDLAGLDPLGAERFHLEMEAGRLAFRDRNTFIADPDDYAVPVAELLSEEYASELRGHIDRDKAMGALPPSSLPVHKDTVYLTVVDGERNAVSFINSIFGGFGSGVVAPKSGVMLQNRGHSFRLDPDHPNCIAPGKRPMHTIIPGMVCRDGHAVMPFGVMGGHYQPYGHAHLVTNVIDYGMDVQEGLDFPRAEHQDGVLRAEPTVPDETIRGLEAKGHKIERSTDPLGGGQAIRIEPETGVLIGGSDPRKDGCALGI